MEQRDALTVRPCFTAGVARSGRVAESVAPWWQALQEELQGRRRQLSSLQELSSQLLLDAAGDDSVEAKEKVHVVSNRLHLLLRQVNAHLPALQHRLVPNTHRSTFGSRLRSYRWFCVLQEISHAESARPEDGGGVTPLQHQVQTAHTCTRGGRTCTRGGRSLTVGLFQEVAGRQAATVGPAPPR